MKHILSVSLGDSDRNSNIIVEFMGEQVQIERIGTDGNKKNLCELLKSYDGKVTAFGLGGTDLYIYAGDKRYTIVESNAMAENAKITPIVDGSGIKATLERRLPDILKKKYDIDLANKKVLMVCAVDRFGLAESLASTGCTVTYGDLVYGLGINYPLHSIKALQRMAKILLPIICRLPVKYFYPIGKKQSERVNKHQSYFLENEVIAGDFHIIKRFMPTNLCGKIIITNTVTEKDYELLKSYGAKILVTTTPKMQGRSFGTNVLEALLVAMGAKSTKDYEHLLEILNIQPCVEYLY